MKLWRRHRCPPCVSLRIFVNDELIVGPLTGEELAYIVRFGGGGELDLLDPDWTGMRGAIRDVRIVAEYSNSRVRTSLK